MQCLEKICFLTKIFVGSLIEHIYAADFHTHFSVWPTRRCYKLFLCQNIQRPRLQRLRGVDALEIPKREKIETLQVKRSWWCSTDSTCVSVDSDWATLSASAVCWQSLSRSWLLCLLQCDFCLFLLLCVSDILSTVQTYTLCSVFSLQSVSIWMMMFTQHTGWQVCAINLISIYQNTFI